MERKQVSKSFSMLEYISILACFFHSGVNLALPQVMELEPQLLLFIFVAGNLFVNNRFNGTRIHLWPMIFALSLYGIALVFETLDGLTFLFYFFMIMFSFLLLFFFGSVAQFTSYETTGKHACACVDVQIKQSGHRVLLYYPSDKADPKEYRDLKWAQDGEDTLRGLMKFGLDLVPQNPFKHLLNARMNVKYKAPLAKLEKKLNPIIFSHGVGGSVTFFSTICKELASQGHLVFTLEHQEGSALTHPRLDENNKEKMVHLKHFDIRDYNEIVLKLADRMKEISILISEIPILAKTGLGEQGVVDMDQLTLMGHGFGATTAIFAASKDNRIKRVISYDPYLIPLKDQIDEKAIKLTIPHCSVNSEIFQHQALLEENWNALLKLFEPGKRKKEGKSKSLLSVINGASHMAFTDLSMMLVLEFRLCFFTPSLKQAFRGQYNMNLINDVTKAFFVGNGMVKDQFSYEELIHKIKQTHDVSFDIC